MKKLESFNWKPYWTTHMGCLCACKDYLGVEVSDAAIYGVTGHAFVINVHEVLCPSGPTAWRTMMVFENMPNLGLKIGGHFGIKFWGEEKFAQIQKDAFAFVKKNIDADLPCYAWDLEMPEFYLIHGYDDTGYYYKGFDAEDGKGPWPWEKLGTGDIGIIEMYNLSPCEAQPAEVILKRAFEAALKHANRFEDWIFEGYHSGTDAYDCWIAALEQGKAGVHGNSYNAGVWSECRKYAVDFLDDYQYKVSGDHQALVVEALDHYRVVAENLAKIVEMYPFQGVDESFTLPVDETSTKAVVALKAAKEAEGNALKVLEKFVTL